ncbi:MAG: DUF5723 family protein [Bacteroidota bacterium]
MNLVKIKQVVLLVFFMLFFYASIAQQSNTFYFMRSVPQTADMNPAFSVSCNYIGLPLISSFHVDIGNTGFSYNQLFPERGEARVINFDHLENRLHNLDLFNARMQFDLFSLGMWYKEYFFTFSITEKTNLFVGYPKNLFLVPWEGNTDYVGEMAEIRRFGGDFSHYREYAVSASTWLDSDLKVGARAGLLFGKANLSTRREVLDIYTHPDNYQIDVSGSYRVNSTLPIEVTKDAGNNLPNVRFKEDVSMKKLLLNGSNPGINFDVGAFYTGLEEIVLYGGINDLGLMYWTSELNNIEAEQQFQFNGITRDDLQNDDYPQLMLDSLAESYETRVTHEPYLTVLPAESYIGATYQLNNRIRAGVLQRNLFYKWRIYPSLTLSLNAELWDFFSLAASYSYNHYSFSNFGAGFSVQSNNVQFYVATDNLRAVNPLSVRNVNLRFGLNVFFGCGSQSGGTGGTGAACYWIKQQEENKKIVPRE